MMLSLNNLSISQIRYLTDSSLFWFIKIFGRAAREAGEDSTEEIHKPLCDWWQNPNNKRVGIGMPRDWFKSTDFNCWDATRDYLLDPEERQLIVMEKAGLAKKKLSFIKQQFLKNTLLRKVYWDRLHELTLSWTKNKDNRWSSEIIDLPREGIYADPSIQIVGIKSAAQSGHFTQIRLDDIIGKAALESIAIMENAFSWIDNVNELLVDPHWNRPTGSRVKIVGSPWGPGDAYDYIKNKYPEYKWHIVPCQKDETLEDTEQIKWIQNPNVSQGESNFPLFTTEYYEEMKANPEKSGIYWAQHACQPQKSTGLHKFEYDWLRFYDWEDRGDDGLWIILLDDEGKRTQEEYALNAIPLYGMIDPGGFAETKSLKRGSNNAIVIGGQPKDSIKKIVVYTWRGKLKTPSKFLDEVFKAHKAFQPRCWRIETIGAQKYIYRDILEAREKRKSYLSISPLPEDKSRDAKNHNIQALIGPMSNGEIYIHRTMFGLISEVKDHPHGFTNDLIDMLGRLNEIYWSRRKMVDVEKYARDSHVESVLGRNPISGY